MVSLCMFRRPVNFDGCDPHFFGITSKLDVGREIKVDYRRTPMWVEEFLAWAQDQGDRQKSDEKAVTAKCIQKAGNARKPEQIKAAVDETPSTLAG